MFIEVGGFGFNGLGSVCACGSGDISNVVSVVREDRCTVRGYCR